eukprot:6077569-Pyramimonas_sp.AAC.1
MSRKTSPLQRCPRNLRNEPAITESPQGKWKERLRLRRWPAPGRECFEHRAQEVKTACAAELEKRRHGRQRSASHTYIY